MKKLVLALVAAASLALAVTSCTTVKPGYGFFGQAVVPGVSMVKTGEAEGTFLFGRFPLMSADISVATAAKNGGIKKIATIDTKKFSLGPITKITTIVTGE